MKKQFGDKRIIESYIDRNTLDRINEVIKMSDYESEFNRTNHIPKITKPPTDSLLYEDYDIDTCASDIIDEELS